MSADKRTPHTDALDTLGLIHEYDEHRDAIHLGVEPVTAGTRLKAGWDIGIKDGVAVRVTPHLNQKVKALGIVDPFLKTDVQKGDKFWLVVYPREITSLRHVWEHPDFPASGETIPPAPVEISEDQWKFIEKLKDSPIGKAWEAIEEFAESISSDEDEDWIRGIEVTPEELIEKMIEVGSAENWNGDYWSNGDQFEGTYIPSHIWDAVELVKNVQLENRENFFSCSC